jgi:hypothetical protein
MAPDPKYLNGRHMGDDFIIKDGFRMYHGKSVPGFPGHPHRGFETITVVRKGIVDHADSMGAAGTIWKWRCAVDDSREGCATFRNVSISSC